MLGRVSRRALRLGGGVQEAFALSSRGIAGQFGENAFCAPSSSGRASESFYAAGRWIRDSPRVSHKSKIPEDAETIDVTFINRDGSEQTVKVPLGWHMLEAAHAYDIELEVRTILGRVQYSWTVPPLAPYPTPFSRWESTAGSGGSGGERLRGPP